MWLMGNLSLIRYDLRSYLTTPALIKSCSQQLALLIERGSVLDTFMEGFIARFHAIAALNALNQVFSDVLARRCHSLNLDLYRTVSLASLTFRQQGIEPPESNRQIHGFPSFVSCSMVDTLQKWDWNLCT